jgi:hypothetical protein
MNEKLLTKFILSFLIEKEDYLKLTQEQQGLVFETCKVIMTAIYNSIKYENVYPVIMCGDLEAQKIIKASINSISGILPSTEKITVHLIQ